MFLLHLVALTLAVFSPPSNSKILIGKIAKKNFSLQQSTTSVYGQYNSTPITLVNGQKGIIQLDSSGNMYISLANSTIPLPTNAAQETGGNLASISTSTALLPINLNPYAVCLADIGGSGDTVGVEYINSSSVVIPMVDSNSVSWSAITITIGASASVGLSYAVLHTSPDGTHPISALPTGAVACRLRVITGTANVPTVVSNTGGTTDGSAGTGTTGYATGFNPTSSTPTALFVLDTYTVGRVRQ